jgi:hypothetical protein
MTSQHFMVLKAKVASVAHQWVVASVEQKCQ